MEFSEPAALARSQAGSADAPRPRHHRGVVRFLIDECLTVDLVSVAGQFAPDSPLEGTGFELPVPGCDESGTTAEVGGRRGAAPHRWAWI